MARQSPTVSDVLVSGSNQNAQGQSQIAVTAQPVTNVVGAARQQAIAQAQIISSPVQTTATVTRQQAIAAPITETTTTVSTASNPTVTRTQSISAVTTATGNATVGAIVNATGQGQTSTSPTNGITINQIQNLIEKATSTIKAPTVTYNQPSGNTLGQIQFYANGKFGFDKDFKYDSSTDTLQLSGALETGNLTVFGKSYFGNSNTIYITGYTQPGQALVSLPTGNLGWTNLYANSNVASYLVSYNGNLSAGNATFDNSLTDNSVANTASIGNVTITGNANLGSVNTLTITGGSEGQVLTTTGTGALRWATISANGNVAITSEITNGSSNVIVNADSNVTFGVAGQSEVLTVTQKGAQANLFTSNNYTLGNSTTTISTTKWLDAITLTTNPTVLFTASNAVSSIDVHITADDGNSKQITKMLSVTKGETTTYSQYGNVTIGNNMAAFTMDQSSGLVRVISQPTTANRVDYRLVVTLYN